MALNSRQLDRRRRLITGALSGAIHVALLAALVTIRPAVSPAPVELEPIPVMLAPAPPEPLPPPEPEPEAEKPKPAAPKTAPPAPRKDPPPPKLVVARVKPAPPTVIPLPAVAKAAYGFTEASDGEMAGASTAEGGGGSDGGGSGAGCNMTRRLQAALRKDRQAQAAMSQAHRGRPIMMWNGDWVRHPSQEGAGLAAVREAILWEVGFAPEACKTEPQRGMVLISMNDGPGAARLVVGSGAWRWQDLLFTRGRGRRARN